MRGPSLANWLDKPGYIAVVAFVAGAAIAGIVVAIVLTRRGGDGEAQETATAVSTGTQTPEVTGTGTPATSTPTASRFTNAPDALAAYVQDQLGETYLGPCPPSATGQIPPGLCSRSLYESDQLATYVIGPPLSEGIGEAVLTVDPDGNWSLDFVPAAPMGEGLSVGKDAVVFLAGDCLNFRAEASTTAQSLSCQLDGTRARVTEGPVQAGGVTWWKLEGFGWASAQFLQPAQ